MPTEQTGIDLSAAPEEVSQVPARREERNPAREQDGPEQVTSLVQLAIEKGVDVAVLERLVALQERVTERNAELAMAEALSRFQEECPPVPRVGTAEVKKNGVKQYEYHFAPLEKIAEVIRPFLQKHGLSYAHDAEVGNGSVTVTCTLQHVDGAKRTATFTGPFDNSGGKNPLQAVGSARSYGRRYTLIDVLGLMTEEDDDGVGTSRAGEVKAISEAQLKKLNDLADQAGADKAAFCRLMGVGSMAEIPAVQYKLAELTLKKKIEAAKEGDDA